MKFRNLFACGLILLLVALTFVVALEAKKSDVIIRTKPYQNLTLKFVNADDEEVLQTYSNRSRKFGELRWAFYSVVGNFKLFVTDVDTEGAEPVEYGPYQTGVPIEINFSGWSAEGNPSPPPAQSNGNLNATNLNTSSTNSTTNSSSGQSAGNSPITGLAIEGDGLSSNLYYFVAIGAFALAMAALVVRRLLRSRMIAPAPPSPVKFDKVEKVGPHTEGTKIVNRFDAALQQRKATGNAENRIAGLQKQLDELKNEERIVDLQKQIAIEKESLRKMREGLGGSS